MSEWMEFLSSLEIPDLVLCAAAVLILDLFAIAVILAASRESKLCGKRWERVGSGVGLRMQETFVPLEADEILLGRHVSADIRIADASVSRYHAVMTVTGGVWSITDLGSTSGTFINEHRVKQGRVHPGDIIRLGNVQLQVTDKASVQTRPRKRKGGNRRV